MRKLIRKVAERAGLVPPRRATRQPRALYACPGIDWNLADAGRFLSEVLPRYAIETAYPESAVPGSREYFHGNPWFSLVDAAVCHAFVRERTPSLVIEVGSGMSSRVIRGALARNGAGRLISVDPEPRADTSGIADEAIARPAQDLPLDFFLRLGRGDVLFVDSSHRAEVGGDVPFLFLDVLPRLSSGVLVHVHDVFLPEDYPAEWLDWGYDEQYVLGALLTGSRAWRVLWPGRLVVRERAGELARLFPPHLLGLTCSLWMERV